MTELPPWDILIGWARIAGWLTGRTGTSGLTATGRFPDLPGWL